MSGHEDLAVRDMKIIRLTRAIEVLEQEAQGRQGFDRNVMIQAANILSVERLDLIQETEDIATEILNRDEENRPALRVKIEKAVKKGGKD